MTLRAMNRVIRGVSRKRKNAIMMVIIEERFSYGNNVEIFSLA
jgi:hypothetical protein